MSAAMDGHKIYAEIFVCDQISVVLGVPARWWTEETVAVVTGGNKGIGFDIVRKLAQEGLTVVLAARDEERGLKAAQVLHAEGLKNVRFRKLDVSDPTSVTAFVNWIKQTYGGLDILVRTGHLNLQNFYETKFLSHIHES